ncbi:MAG TPA: SRPBCC family protein [Kineosporiaceae bacterium]|nr:SRPBCC family protein [Kineosporiaceae bacterium]
MPGFTLTGSTPAPVEEVWKLLFDPTRFPEWWSGVETVRTEGPDRYTMWPDGYPGFPMPQSLRTERDTGRVTVSCQVSDIEIVWQLVEAGSGTRIEVRVALPDTEAHRLPTQRQVIAESLDKLGALAAAAVDVHGERTEPGR